MSELTPRVAGTVHKVSLTWAIIEGDNGVHYFMMPTDVVAPSVFRDLVPRTELVAGTRVEGEPYEHKGRPRMKAVVVVVTLSNATVAHGEAR